MYIILCVTCIAFCFLAAIIYLDIILLVDIWFSVFCCHIQCLWLLYMSLYTCGNLCSKFIEVELLSQKIGILNFLNCLLKAGFPTSSIFFYSILHIIFTLSYTSSVCVRHLPYFPLSLNHLNHSISLYLVQSSLELHSCIPSCLLGAPICIGKYLQNWTHYLLSISIPLPMFLS